MHVHNFELCPIFWNVVDCNLSGSSVLGILQASIFEWLPFPPLRDPPNPGIEIIPPVSSALAGKLSELLAPRESS